MDNSIARRNNNIDFLRFIAVTSVMVSHYHLVPSISSGLWTGVDLFFVISGFLISSLLFKEISRTGKLNLRRFYIRRALRILPTFYLYLIGTILIFSVIGKDFSIITIISELLFLQNYLTSFNEHTWSLAVEEHFYLFFPVILLFTFSRNSQNQRLFITLIFLLSVLILILRIENSASHTYQSITHHYPTHLRLDSILFGVVIAYIYNFHNSLSNIIKKSKIANVYVMVAFLLPFWLPISSPFINTYGLTALYLASGVLVLKSTAAGNSINSKIFKLCAFIGKHSYAIYLWHLNARTINVIVLSIFGIEDNNVFSFITYIILSITIGVMFSITFERYFLNLRDKFFP